MGNDNSSSKRKGFYNTPTPRPDDAAPPSFDAAPPSINIDSMLEQISEEIDDDYVDEDKKTIPDAANVDVGMAEASDHPYKHLSLSFVPQQNTIQKISQIFTYQKQLGCGASCRVLLVTDTAKPNIKFALKEMQKRDALNRHLFAQEYKVMNILKGHPNILSFHSCYIDRSCYYIATQFCSGGTMLDRILRQKYFNEQQCSEFMKNVLFGLEHMHKHHIVHRDIKCENLIFDKTGNDGVVKIIDFGNSELITDPNAIDKSLIGSLHYLPPELLQTTEPRTKASLYKGDMWALGVVCYILITGEVPFFGKDKAQTLKSIRRGHYDWPQNIQLSDSCKDFLSKLLEKDIGKRMSVETALKHEWISDTNVALDINFGDEHLNQIQIFLRANQLQKILVNAILSEMDESDKRVLLQALRDLNMNGDGKISEHDVINYILCHGKVGDEESEKQQLQQSTRRFISHVRDLSRQGVLGSSKLVSNSCQKEELQINLDEIDVDAMLDEIDDDQKYYAGSDDDDDEDEANMVYDPSYDDGNLGTIPETDVFAELDEENDESLPETSIVAKISVERFQAIMENAEKEYDVSSLIKKLRPTDSGFIPLQNISGFTGMVHSEDSNNNRIDSFVQTGLASLDVISDDDDDHVMTTID